MRTVTDIICAIRLRHGEVVLTPGDLLALVAEIKRLEDELAMAALNDDRDVI